MCIKIKLGDRKYLNKVLLKSYKIDIECYINFGLVYKFVLN